MRLGAEILVGGTNVLMASVLQKNEISEQIAGYSADDFCG
jgi:hypothetical protein